MLLRDIVDHIDCQAFSTKGQVDLAQDTTDVHGIQFDSRKIEQGDLFVAQCGVHVDGHEYIDDTIHRGAAAIICQRLPKVLSDGVVYLMVENSDNALGIAASNFYGNPSAKLRLIGITGTNGKTTTVTLLHWLFRLHGCHVGLLSTIVNKIDEEELPATHTTPDALELNSLLARMTEQGCEYCFMEVSSHSVVQQRIAGLTFAGGIFSNITQDHLDFHKTMANYITAKKGFFDSLSKEAFALVNKDDRNGLVMVQNCNATVKTYSLQTIADFHCKIEESSFQGQQLLIDGKSVWVKLVGRFNAYNLTAIYATAVLCGVEKEEALRLLSMLDPAEGRFEHVDGKGITAIVDYAHTPDALENVIRTINNTRKPQQNLIVVVGCGGDRDALKRPIMARIGAQGCDRLILTSDNPRTEDPDAILDMMEAGLSDEERSNTVRITDRRQAIKTAVMIAKEGDIILVAGKGHEKYQEINGIRHHFDDKEELRALLNQGNS